MFGGDALEKICGFYEDRCIQWCGELSEEIKVSKFVPRVQQLTFNARSRVNRVESLTYITGRAVFVRRKNGLVLTEVAPGIDHRRDVLDQIPFDFSIDEHLKPMDAALFRPPQLHSA